MRVEWPGLHQGPRPSLTVGLLKSPTPKSVARASARAVPQPNHLRDPGGMGVLRFEKYRNGGNAPLVSPTEHYRNGLLLDPVGPML